MTSSKDYIVVFITAANFGEADKISEALVTERLAACVNIVSTCRSVYRWQGELVKDDEVLMIVKTGRERFAALEQRVTELHSYDVPEIVGLDISELSAAYERFLRDSI